MIYMVREPSETPNITNIDDIVPIRYAYGGQNGYVIGKGEELNAILTGNKIKIGSGRVVLQGVESNIDVNGVEFTIDNLNLDRFYVIYYEVNLGLNKTSLEISSYSTTGIPEVEAGDDLTETPSGIAKMPLYNVYVKNNVVSVEKVVKPIKYLYQAINERELIWQGVINGSINDGIVDPFIQMSKSEYDSIFAETETMYELIGYMDIKDPSTQFNKSSSRVPFICKIGIGTNKYDSVFADTITCGAIRLQPYITMTSSSDTYVVQIIFHTNELNNTYAEYIVPTLTKVQKINI